VTAQFGNNYLLNDENWQAIWHLFLWRNKRIGCFNSIYLSLSSSICYLNVWVCCCCLQKGNNKFKQNIVVNVKPCKHRWQQSFSEMANWMQDYKLEHYLSMFICIYMFTFISLFCKQWFPFYLYCCYLYNCCQ